MKKREFLKKLSNALRLYMPKKERLAIMGGYEEYFSNNDTPEEELVSQCGDIGLIVSENIGGRVATKMLFPRVLLYGALCLYVFFAYRYIYHFPFNMIFIPLFTTLFFIPTLVLLGKNATVKCIYPMPKAGILFVANTALLFVAVALVYILPLGQLVLERPSEVGVMADRILLISSLFFTVLLFLSGISVFKYGRTALIFTLLNFTILTSLGALLNGLSWLTSVNNIPQIFLSTSMYTALTAAVGGILCIASIGVARRKA